MVLPRRALSTATNPAISLHDITKLFGRFAALRGVTADFRPGTLSVLLGENGAGKSTLMRIACGLAQPSSGSVTLHGTLGYMAHATMLYDELTGMENLSYFAQLYGLTDSACIAAISAVGLDPALARHVRDYSQGMRQRLSLARAILNEPEILLLDEPFSNVDIASTSQMAKLLGELRDRGKTLLVITHQPAALSKVADEYIVLREGRITERSRTLTEVWA
ncbi:MAG: ABC transporter ATP-binding protein [Acidobacteriales bacterium]|nr:ABC transporter ATP-binding protein [Terriglobales bacterium]